MKANILIIDGQIFQTEARDRGMGRYSACLVEHIIGLKKYKDVRVIIKKGTESQDKCEIELKQMFENSKIVCLDLVNTSRNKIETAASHNKKIINEYVKNSCNDE